MASYWGVKHLRFVFFKFKETRLLFIRFSQNLAKFGDTYFEIFSRNQSAYEFIMDGGWVKHLNIYLRILS